MAPIITAIAAANDASSENSDKYAEGLRKANEALRDLMELVSMPDFEQRDGWKRKNSNRSDIVFSKRYSMGKVFTMRTVFDFPLQQAFAEHWENFIDIIHYNKNISNVRVIAELSAHADVVYFLPLFLGNVESFTPNALHAATERGCDQTPQKFSSSRTKDNTMAAKWKRIK
ncbi:hypothetical protein Tcan_16739 [Toxocara canis]|uniref:START domain-containing protein n=1 Tax=Toxocara canis TaxID=6265 RepID=A0A0B2V751_TOXCA|nr:hypothetical protein Tcan_16739 [Toxocara canis]